MTPEDRSFEVATPPWIALEFSFPRQDVRALDTLHNSGSTVRTGTYSRQVGGGAPYMDLPMGDFKTDHPLVDVGGNVIDEPVEGDLATVACLRRCVWHLVRAITGAAIIFILAVAYLRLFYGSCYSKFFTLTQAWCMSWG